MSEFRVGYAQAVITPPLDLPVYLAGFGRNRVAQSVHDDLYARVLLLDGFEQRLALVALDLIGLTYQHCREVTALVNQSLIGTEVLIACTHVHHGPDTIGLWGPDLLTSGVNPTYMRDLKGTIVRLVSAAAQNMQAASMRAVTIPVTGLAKNARNPDVRDEELSCLQFVRPGSAAPLVTWLIYPCHPEVLWDGNPHITSDYAHSLRARVEAETNAPAIFMVGALGGMMTPDVRDHSFEESAAMGEALAAAALRALAQTVVQPVTALSHQRRECALPIQSFLLEQAVEGGLLPEIRDKDGLIATETSITRVGSAWIAAVPGELLPELGLLIKAEMKAAGALLAAVVGLANDEIGYILPEEDYLYPDNPYEPGEHYEETMSLGPQTASRLLAALRSLYSQ
jgi:hypothetical protein